MLRYALSVAVGIGVYLSPALGQDFRATITGQVTDATGAAVPGAKVRAIQKTTNQTTEVASDKDGYFTLPYLPPSTYDVEAASPGFRTLRRENVTLLVAQKLDLPFKLELGGVSTEITVTDTIETVQSADASLGLNFDSLQTSEYPLNGRQVYMLLDLTPGVLFTQEEFGATGFSGTRGWDVNGSYVMNGGVQGTNSFSLNGAPVSLTGSWQLAPNVDAIQEFKVQTNTYDAQIARTGGGSVNTTLRSGANRTYGTVFEFIRNSVLDSNWTQNNRVGAPKGKHIVNNYGGTTGFALRKDKDFLFLSFEGWRERVPFPKVSDTPPLDLRDGQHFTAYKIKVYDPLTVHPCVPGVDVSGNCSSPYIRVPFPDNVIPKSRISPIGEKILSFYPAPNVPGQQQNFVYANNTGRYFYDQPMGKWDHVRRNDRFSTTITFQHGEEYRNQTFPGPAASGNIHSQRTSLNLITNWTRILSPTAILDVRASFGRFTSLFPDAEFEGITAQDLGMTGMVHAPTNTGNNPPRILMDQYTNLFGNGGNLYTWGTDNQWNVVPTVTVTRGKKTLKFGVDLIYAARGSGNIGQANGQFSFDRSASRQYALRQGGNNDGAGIADVLLGAPGSGFIDWNDTYYRTWPYMGFFVQNDWKVRRNVTLNLGFRYDVQFPWKERWNRANAGWDFNAKNPLSDQIIAAWAANKKTYDANPSNKIPYPDPPAAILGGKTFLQPGGARNTYNTDWQCIQPRIGLAWEFARNSVLRTGFGIVHKTATQTGYVDGFSIQTPYLASLDDGITPSALVDPRYSLVSPFPDNLIQPKGRDLGLLTNVGNSASLDGSQRVIPRTFQYSFGLQRRFPWRVLIDTSYVGSMTNHDTMAYNLNAMPMAYFMTAHANNQFGDRQVPNPFFGIVPRNSSLGGGATIAAKNLMTPYPLFNSNITLQTNPWARYRYDGLQLRAEKRFTGDRSKSGALTLIFTYTFSKTFECNHRLNNWNLNESCIHEISNYDKPQNISFSGVWDLPVGRRRAFFSTPNKYVSPLISGWTANWIFRFTSGVPVGKMNVQYLCGSYLAPSQDHDHWFNNDSKCYKSLPGYTVRNVEDRFADLRQMDNPSLNVSLSKTFYISERWKYNFKAEAFNVTNKPLYGGPDTGYTNARFGMLPIGQQNFPRNIQISSKLMF